MKVISRIVAASAALKCLASCGVRFLNDRRGVAAMEFAMIAPVLIVLYMGSVEIVTGIDVNRKLDRAATTMSALLTQEKDTTTPANIKGIMDIGAAAFLPYTRDTPQITVTAIDVSSDGKKATVAWSFRRVNGIDTIPFTKTSAITLEPSLLIKDSSVIRVDMSIAYVPLMAWTIKSQTSKANGVSAVGITLSDRSFGRVRMGKSAKCTAC